MGARYRVGAEIPKQELSPLFFAAAGASGRPVGRAAFEGEAGLLETHVTRGAVFGFERPLAQSFAAVAVSFEVGEHAGSL